MRLLSITAVLFSISPVLLAAPTLPAPAAAPATIESTPLPLPGGPPVGMDYLAFDPATARLWIPAGNTGRVDVLDTRSGKLEAIEGLPTEKRGERTAGPSSAAAGDGFVYVGNRAGSQICAFDARSLAKRGCLGLAHSPDGLQYVRATQELWVTTPRDQSVTVLSLADPVQPKAAGRIAFEGEPEGYAIDAERGVFYTNLEDKDLTLAVDVRARKVVATWKPACGEQGPRGLALDPKRRLLFVACAAGRVKALDAGRDGKLLGELKLGGGVDNIDYAPARGLLFAASAREGLLIAARVADSGALEPVARFRTAAGGRSAFADADGTAYVPDSAGGRLWVAKLPR